VDRLKLGIVTALLLLVGIPATVAYFLRTESLNTLLAVGTILGELVGFGALAVVEVSTFLFSVGTNVEQLFSN